MVSRLSRKAGSGQKTIQEGQEWSEGHSGGLEVVGMQSWWAESGRKAFLDCREWSGDNFEGQEWSGGHHEGVGMVMRPFRSPGVVSTLSRKAGVTGYLVPQVIW